MASDTVVPPTPDDDLARHANTVHAAGERYARLGWSMLPIEREKKTPPERFGWKPFMRDRPDASQRYTWYIEQRYQIAIICGPVSGNLVVADMDGVDETAVVAAYNQWCLDFPIVATLPVVETGSGRRHVYFRTPTPIAYQSVTLYGVRTELRQGGHYVVAPPSIHPNGQPYRWLKPPWHGVSIVDPAALGLPSRPAGEEEPSGTPFVAGEPLSEAEREQIATLLAGHWHPGQRHDLTLALAGWLAGKDVPEADAWAIVTALAEEGDDRRTLRRAVRDTYRRASDGTSTSGWSRLVDRHDPLVSPATAKSLDLLLRARDTPWSFPIGPAATEHPWLVMLPDLLAEPDEGDAWLCDELVRAETVTWVAGQPKTLKSMIQVGLLTAIAAGLPAFGTFHVERPRPVALIQEESARRYLRRRLAATLNGMGLTPEGAGRFAIITNQRFRIDQPDQVRRLVEECLTAHQPQLLGMDPFRSFHWMDENSADEMQRIMALLLRIRDEFAIALLLVHHMNKNILARDSGEQLRGSSVLWAAADGALFVEATDRSDTVNVRTVLKEGGQAPRFTLRAGFSENGETALLNVVNIDMPSAAPDPELLAVVAAVPWRTQEEIAAALNLTVRSIYKRLAVLVNVGRLVRHQPHRRAKARFALPDCDTTPPEG